MLRTCLLCSQGGMAGYWKVIPFSPYTLIMNDRHSDKRWDLDMYGTVHASTAIYVKLCQMVLAEGLQGDLSSC